MKSDGTIAFDTSTAAFQAYLAAAAEGQEVSEIFTYAIRMANGTLSWATVTVIFTGVNDGPVAVVDVNGADAVKEAGLQPGGNTPEPGDASASGNVLTNDTDVDDGALLTVAEVNGSAANVGMSVSGTYGSVTIGSDGAWTYTLDNTDGGTNALAQGDSVTDQFSYTVTDEFGATDTTTLTITITGTNDAPTDLTFNGGSVAENSANGTVVANVDTVVDPDHVTGFTFDLTDNAGGRFTIDATGIITVANGSLLDYETNSSHNITVRVTDALGATYSEVLTINVTDVPENQAPTDIILSNTSVQENSLNVFLGTLSTVDPDDVSGFTYTLIDSAGGRFELLNGNQIHVARGDLLDFEVATSHQIEVKVEDSDGGIYTEVININLTDMASVTSFGGTGGADIVDGTNGNNSLNGAGGDDRLYGGEGNDTLIGGNGLDALYGQGGNDILSGDLQSDFVLDGGVGNDSLTGGGGNDVLIGGIGADTMDGGGNNDLFIWRAEDLGTGLDVINNFGPGTGPNGTDTLQIGDLLVGYMEGVSTNASRIND